MRSFLLSSIVVSTLAIAAPASAPIDSQAAPAAQPLKVRVDEGSVSFEVATNVFSTTVRGRSGELAGSTQVRETGAALRLEAIEAMVPVASLRTGIKVRDEHMWKYIFENGDGQRPDLAFVAESAECTSAGEADVFTCPASGTLSIRGTPRPMTMELKVSKDGSEFRVTGDGVVVLSSYGIERPSQFGITTGDEVKVHVEFKARGAARASSRVR